MADTSLSWISNDGGGGQQATTGRVSVIIVDSSLTFRVDVKLIHRQHIPTIMHSDVKSKTPLSV
jgi:hypothetical protein